VLAEWGQQVLLLDLDEPGHLAGGLTFPARRFLFRGRAVAEAFLASDSGGVALDASGNAYIAGITSGSFGDQVNAGGEDAFLSKYN
jgi:hypothetical protein